MWFAEVGLSFKIDFLFCYLTILPSEIIYFEFYLKATPILDGVRSGHDISQMSNNKLRSIATLRCKF